MLIWTENYWHILSIVYIVANVSNQDNPLPVRITLQIGSRVLSSIDWHFWLVPTLSMILKMCSLFSRRPHN